jgi:hypothetical protein
MELRSAQARVIGYAQYSDSDLHALHALMIQYADRPMDFADATLVHLASSRASQHDSDGRSRRLRNV